MEKEANDIPWSVILDVVFLNFLDVVVGLGIVHSFCAERHSQYGFSVS